MPKRKTKTERTHDLAFALMKRVRGKINQTIGPPSDGVKRAASSGHARFKFDA